MYFIRPEDYETGIKELTETNREKRYFKSWNISTLTNLPSYTNILAHIESLPHHSMVLQRIFFGFVSVVDVDW